MHIDALAYHHNSIITKNQLNQTYVIQHYNAPMKCDSGMCASLRYTSDIYETPIQSFCHLCRDKASWCRVF